MDNRIFAYRLGLTILQRDENNNYLLEDLNSQLTEAPKKSTFANPSNK